MMRSKDSYKPSTLIRDFSHVPAYYRSKDITWSPLTPIGSLIGAAHEPRGNKSSQAHNPVHKPVFPTGFSLGVSNARLVAASAGSIQNEPQRSFESYSTEMLEFFAAMSATIIGVLAVTWRKITHLKLVPKKYTLERGLYTDYATRTFAFAKISMAISMVLLFVIFGTLHETPTQTIPQNDSKVTSPTATMPVVTATAAANHSTQASNTTTWAWTPAVSSVMMAAVTPPATTTTVASPSTSTTPTDTDTDTNTTTGGMGGGDVTTSPTTPITSTDPTDTGTMPDPTDSSGTGTTTTTDGTSTTVTTDPVQVTVTVPSVTVPIVSPNPLNVSL